MLRWAENLRAALAASTTAECNRLKPWCSTWAHRHQENNIKQQCGEDHKVGKEKRCMGGDHIYPCTVLRCLAQPVSSSSGAGGSAGLLLDVPARQITVFVCLELCVHCANSHWWNERKAVLRVFILSAAKFRTSSHLD